VCSLKTTELCVLRTSWCAVLRKCCLGEQLKDNERGVTCAVGVGDGYRDFGEGKVVSY
jgi:hypothetical protein